MKDNVILNHYKYILENYLFDEYDILGFLIYIRENLDKSSCHSILEFCDLIAHRKRNQGIIRENLVNSINKKYETNKNNKVKGYNGIVWKTWLKEWKKVQEDFGIDILKDNQKLLKQITICIISLAQDSKYYDKDVIIGTVMPVIAKGNYLCLTTTEGKLDSLFVCLLKCGKFQNIKNISGGIINNPLETKRENGNLVLYKKKKKILED